MTGTTPPSTPTTSPLGITPADVLRARTWLDSLSEEWRGEIPTRLHEKGHFGLGSAPPFSPEFIGYIGQLQCKVPYCKECHNDQVERMAKTRFSNQEGRRRTKRVMNRLRRVSPIEWDAVYMYCVLGYTPERISSHLTDRAKRLGKEERYSLEGVYLLLISGADKTEKEW